MDLLPTITHMGYDESNTGQKKSPEICVGIYSEIPSDIILKKKLLPKKRNNHTFIEDRLGVRGYRYLFFSRADYTKIESTPEKKLGIILGGLIYGEELRDYLQVFVDGYIEERKNDFTEGLLSDITGLPRDRIEIISGAKLDRKYNIVNVADETAHWLLQRMRKGEDFREAPHRKILLLEDLL